jgi:glycosyltransferase involved in cell wall biosynthesis
MLIVLSDDVFYKDIYAFPISLIVIKKQNRYKFRTLWMLYNEIKKYKPDLIHSWDNIGTLLISPYIVSSRINLVSSIRYAGVLKETLIGKFIKSFSHRISNTIVSNSKKGLEIENIQKLKKGKVVYNGLDTKDFDSKINENNDYSNKWLGYDKKIVMVGRFGNAKDYISLIKASKILFQSYSNICFVLVGDGPNKLIAENEAGEYLNNGIFFLGKRSDIPTILSQMDIGVLLNNTNGHAEGISNAIMEYMAAGLPVIATDAGGTPELIEDNISGFLVQPFDENVVAQKILWLIDNPDEIKKMGSKGRKIIDNKFSIDKMVDSYINLYNSLC